LRITPLSKSEIPYCNARERDIYLENNLRLMKQNIFFIYTIFLALCISALGQYYPETGKIDTGTSYSNEDPYASQYITYNKFGISFEYPEGWDCFDDDTSNPSEGDTLIQSGFLGNPMDFLGDTSLMGTGSLQTLTATVSWSKALGKKDLDSVMSHAISQRRQKFSDMNVLDSPSIIIDGNTALVKKVYGTTTDGYSTSSSSEIVIAFISSRSDRAIEIGYKKTFRDFDDSDMEYLRHILSTWTEPDPGEAIDLGMPLAPTKDAANQAQNPETTGNL
jgi:hypothetical protein